MAALAPRELNIGTIIDKTLAVIERCAPATLIYFVALTIINAAIGYFALSMTAPLQQVEMRLLQSLVGLICAYFFIDAMVRKTGLCSRATGDAFLPFLALYIVYSIGVVLGFILIIFPGLYIMARWSISQPMLIARGDGPMQALGNSWEETEENAFQILIVVLIFLIPTIAISALCTLMLGQASVAGMLISQVASSATSVLALAMGVALYGLIVGTPKETTAVFE
jgi:uncharacterized membrane protein